MNLPGCVWVLETVICLSIQGGSITLVAGSQQVAVTRPCCTTGQFHSMFSWQIGSRSQVTGEEAGKLSQRDMPLFISTHTAPGWAQDQQENNGSIPACPSLITTDTSHLTEEIVLRLYPNLSGHLLYSFECRDKEIRISLIPQKNFLFGIAPNLLLVHYSLHQLPSKKQFKKGHYELNISLLILLQKQ